jgi:hypothetical protein
MLVGKLPEVEDAAVCDRERAHELHPGGFGRPWRHGDAGLSQAGQAGIGLVTGDVAQRREDHHRVVGLTGGIQRLRGAHAQVHVVGVRLQSHQHRLNVVISATGPPGWHRQ